MRNVTRTGGGIAAIAVTKQDQKRKLGSSRTRTRNKPYTSIRQLHERRFVLNAIFKWHFVYRSRRAAPPTE